MRELKVGDRVKLIPNWSFLQPARKLALDGRLATILFVPNPDRGLYHYRIKFDVKRKNATPVLFNANANELELVQSPSADQGPRSASTPAVTCASGSILP